MNQFLALKARDILERGPRYWGGSLHDQGLNWRYEDRAAVVVCCEAAIDPCRLSPILAREPHTIVWRASDMRLRLPPNWADIIRKKRPREPREDRTLLAYPYIKGQARDEHAFLLAVNAVVPQGLPGDLRSDVCQDMLLAILEGELSVAQIKDALLHYMKAARKRYYMPWGIRSLDDPLWDDGRTLGETLSENPLYQ